MLLAWIVYPCVSVASHSKHAHKKQHHQHHVQASKSHHHAAIKNTHHLAQSHHASKMKRLAYNGHNHHHHHHMLQPTRVPAIPQYAALQVEASAQSQPAASSGFVASVARRLVSFVHNTVSNLSYSVYKLGGKQFDTSNGIYVLDCSNYVDNVLHKIYPHAYSSLVATSGSDQPTSLQYYDFFNRLSERPKHYWNRIDDVEALQPGDILVFRKKNTGQGTAGHVMIVMDKPIRDMNSFLVRVADSAPVGHSQDTRQPHTSGIGIGNLLLKVNPKTGEPLAYAWKVGSRWKENVNFAMGRPYDMHFEY
jgi:hypothetical protein